MKFSMQLGQVICITDPEEAAARDARMIADWAAGTAYTLVGVDNLPGARPLETEPLPRACVLLFGQEGSGLSPEAREAADGVLSIAAP